jgi:hypothetical protein
MSMEPSWPCILSVQIPGAEVCSFGSMGVRSGPPVFVALSVSVGFLVLIPNGLLRIDLVGWRFLDD